MSELIKIVYIGNKPSAYDNVAKSGACWSGKGDVQEVTEAQAKQLLKYPDQWALADQADAAAVENSGTVNVQNEDGENVAVTTADMNKPLEKMTKAELVGLAQAKWGKELSVDKNKKDLIDAIEEFMRDLEPIANVS
jgi:hypothetical protein